MAEIEVKQKWPSVLSPGRTTRRSTRATLGSEMLTASGRFSTQNGGSAVKTLVLLGLVLDLVLEAYLIWESARVRTSE